MQAGIGPFLIPAAALACFHLGSGAMFLLYGLAVVSARQANLAGFVAITIVVAQGITILVSLIATRVAEKEGYWLVLLRLQSVAATALAGAQ
jgi:hypothetical protein